MYIFLKDLENKTNILNALSLDDLHEKVSQKYNSSDIRILHCGVDVKNIYENMNLVVVGKILGGKLTEDDKALANKRIDIKVCRKCNARLSIRATHCRKRKCGFSNKLRLKKKLRETGKK
ncbi:Ubiquitin-60S ribosomal protein L40 [Dictyocoela muelleri]|nr:Ubiquitin-60S ribosomal protein L40 [Dictyocoela muelleri]